MYQKIEPHYNNWVQDLKKLNEKISDYAIAGIEKDEKKLIELQGLVIEYDHLLKDIKRYKYITDRIKRFNSYIGSDINSLSDEKRNNIAKQLKNMLYSSLI